MKTLKKIYRKENKAKKAVLRWVQQTNEWMDGKLHKQRDNRMKETTKDQLDEQTNG